MSKGAPSYMYLPFSWSFSICRLTSIDLEWRLDNRWIGINTRSLVAACFGVHATVSRYDSYASVCMTAIILKFWSMDEAVATGHKLN